MNQWNRLDSLIVALGVAVFGSVIAAAQPSGPAVDASLTPIVPPASFVRDLEPIDARIRKLAGFATTVKGQYALIPCEGCQPAALYCRENVNALANLRGKRIAISSNNKDLQKELDSLGAIVSFTPGFLFVHILEASVADCVADRPAKSADLARADDSSICTNKNAMAAARISACSNIIGRYRPSDSGSASAAAAQNEVLSAYLTRIELYDREDKDDLAIKDADAAIRLGQNNPMVVYFYSKRADLYLKTRDFNGAIAGLTTAIERKVKYPSTSTLYAFRASVWDARGDLDRALSDRTEAIRLDPDQPHLYIARGHTLRYKGDFRGALADYDAALRRAKGATGPDSASALAIPVATSRGLTYERMGDLARARAEFQTVIGLGGNTLEDIHKPYYATAQARLAALDSGTPEPALPAVPSKVTSETSIPTSAATIPIISASPVAGRGRRVALVIGNSGYRTISELFNPKRDAEAVAESLKAIGFEMVTTVNDATREALIDALRKFADEAEKADWALIYYAGHGIQVGGLNYLIPVEARLAVDRDVQFETVPLEQVLASVEQARKLRIVVLDACRANPFAQQMRRTAAPDAIARADTAGAAIGTRSVGRGLGRVEVTGATLVVYSAKDGQTALDGDGANSPFAIAFVQRIATAGVEINKVFRLVRDDVMELTAGRQEPYTYGSLPGREDLFFVEKR